MKHLAPPAASLLVGLLLAACGGQASAPVSSAPTQAAASGGTAKPGTGAVTGSPGALASSKPAASSSIEPVTDANWAATVEAAKKEGSVTIWGDNGPAAKAFEKDAFEKAYPGITVDLYQAGSQSDRDSRFIKEWQAGVAKLDIEISGSAGVNARVKPLGALQDVHPFLKPDILNPRTWRNGKMYWVDKEQKYMLQSDTNVYPVIVNKSVDAAEIQNFSDLLKPKFKGKIISTDPRQSGSGFSEALFLYYAPGLGKDFFDEFYGNGRVVLSSDEQKNLEWTDQGRMLVDINARNVLIEPQRKLGGTFKALPSLKVNGKQLEKFSGSPGIMFIPNITPLPHPNAAKVYANWFYSKEGQQAMVDILAQPSNRADVDMSRLPDYSVPKDGVEYLNMNDEMFTDGKNVKTMRDELERIFTPPQG